MDAEPPLNPERVERLEKVGDAVCPICGERTWRRPGELGNLLAWTTFVTRFGEKVAAAGETAGRASFMFVCAACGFVRLHDVDVLLQPGEDSEDAV